MLSQDFLWQALLGPSVPVPDFCHLHGLVIAAHCASSIPPDDAAFRFWQLRPRTSASFDPSRGFRYGEATNPGPSMAPCRHHRCPFPFQSPPPATLPNRAQAGAAAPLTTDASDQVAGVSPKRWPQASGASSEGRPASQTTIADFFAPSAQAAAEAVAPTIETQPEEAAQETDEAPVFKLAVVNPTSILHKEASLLELRCHAYMLSETSAVQEAQNIVQKRLRETRLQWVWGSAVSAHHHEGACKASLRGRAAGVALASVFPLRAPFKSVSGPAFAAQRLAVGHIRFGPLHARLLVLYGWPANHAAANSKNEQLFQEALSILRDSAVPTIVGGDLNTDVTQLDAWADFQHLGYAELFRFYQQRFAVSLPATCRGSTRHDTVLLPPVFQQLLQQACVDEACQLFDSHAPVCLTFRLPSCNPGRAVWRKPTSWMPLEPSAQEVDTVYGHRCGALRQSLAVCSSRDDLESCFQSWAAHVEDAVDAALRTAHTKDPLRCPRPGLPRQARGRCVFREVKSRAYPVATPGARPGDYRPPDEPMSRRSRLKVKQVRRLQAFGRKLRSLRGSYGQQPVPASAVRPLLAEWQAIQGARGYAPCFKAWLLQVAHFEVFYAAPALSSSDHRQHHTAPDQLQTATNLAFWPPDDWLEDVLSFVRFECEAVICQEHSARCKLQAYRCQQDAAQGLQAAYRSVRPDANPPFTAVPVSEAQTADLQCCAHDSWGLYRLPAPEFYQKNCPALADAFPAEVGSLVDDEVFGPRLWVRVPDRPYMQHFRLCQSTEASTPKELHRSFTDYWHAIWNRDVGQATVDLDQWSDFVHALPSSPEAAGALQLDFTSLDFWRDHLRNLKPNSATGYCGFSNRELKWLPDQPLADLIDLFRLCTIHGWPRHLASATVSVLAKIPVPLGMQHGRPITVFANLYRLWASGVAKAILRQWSTWLPPGVKGSIPGRSVRDLSLSIECRIEQSFLDNLPFAGFSIDIVKCFNQLARLPLRFLLGHLQVPEPILHAWFDFLASSQRRPVFHNCIGPPVMSTTGMPEGCPLSVLAQVAVCWAAQARDLSFGAELSSYVDNFTWTGPSRAALAEAILDSQAFCRSLKLPIDWTKSFCWATCRQLKKWLQGPAQQLLPPEASLRVVDGAKDLGIAFKFRRSNALQTAQKRISEGQRRLECLLRPSLPLFDKARIIQTSIWPAALYGLEGRLLPDECVSKLRTGACRALVGPRPSASPILALSALTSRVVDPEVYLLCQSVLALQRLFAIDEALAKWWLTYTADHLSTARRAIGPATALALLLQRNGWSLSPDGKGTGPGHAFFDLRVDRPKVVRTAIKTAWLSQVPEKVRSRNGMLQAGVPLPDLTDKVLSEYGAGFQVHLAQSIVGGFMSNAARATWDPLQTAQCSLCGRPDSKHHRLYQCPAADPLRHLYQPLLSWITAEMPHWTHCPFPVEHASEAFLRLYWRSRRLVTPPQPHHLLPLPTPTVHFFTDGACNNPTVPAARHAAWAVVMYVADATEDFAGAVQLWQQCAVPPVGWHTVARGVVPGLQDINRAEYCAIIQALQMARYFAGCEAVIWSDSANALKAVGASSGYGTMPSARHFASDLEPDNLLLLRKGVLLRKVQAHQDLAAASLNGPPHEAFTALGNAIADSAARTALREDLPLSAECCQHVLEWRQQQEQCFRLFCRYLTELTKIVVPAKRSVRAAAMPSVEATVQPTTVSSPWLHLQPEAAACPLQVSVNTVHHHWPGGWPDWYGTALLQWLEDLRWPRDLAAPSRHAGITYVELLVNFVVTTAVLPPVRLATSAQAEWVSLLEPGGILLPAILRELTVQFVASIGQLGKTLGIALWPSPRHHRLYTLELCGSTGGRKGLLYRPLLRKLHKTSEVLEAVLDSARPGEELREAAWSTGRVIESAAQEG